MIWIVATGAIDIANDPLITLSILIDFENCKLRIMMIIDDFIYIINCLTIIRKSFVFNKTMKL